MHLGLFMMPLHPPGRPMHETLAEDTEKSLLADRLGFQEVWVGEHFSATSEPIASPLMFMAGLVHRTSLTFGTGVINLPHPHPALVAAYVAQCDHLSQGRDRRGP
ncbi:MAG: LLM class flavin-dependent oxidoreductase, partial [Alphaproteobacteria bacterium]